MSNDHESSDFWRELKRLFEQAQACPPDEQEDFLRRSCGENKRLYQEVTALLAAAGDENDPVVDIIGKAAAHVTKEDSLQEKTLGHYQIIKRLGKGGMGHVYLGERIDEQFDQRVAIKVLASRFPAPEVVQRFRSERQILANLEHPNIARLIDGGETSDGLPYLVMEYVEGQEIDDYCRDQNLTLRQRLALFRDVCSAIEYAHRNLVVHRDIKPSNILVTQNGTPKLLDFGIVRLLDTNNVDRPETLLAMTPEYASPEHVLGQQITTASDIYSLGVLLYELLTGKRPHDFTGKRPSEIERELFHSLPDKPSRSVGDNLRLNVSLSDELDSIVMVALRPSAEERYASVGEFSADIRRYLEGRPIQARPHSLIYLLSKFVARNRVAVAGGLFFAISLVAGVFYHINQITTERDRVALEAQKTAAVSEFLKDIFRVANPDRSQGRSMTARDILDQGAERLASDLDEQPEIRAELLSTVGTVYSYLGLYDEATDKLNQSIELSRTLGIPEDLANRLLVLAATSYDMGNIAASEAAIQEAGEIIDKEGFAGTFVDASHTYEKSQVLFHSGEYETALVQAKEALKLAEQLDSSQAEHIETAALHAIGQLLHFQGRLEESEDYLRRSLVRIETRESVTPSIALVYRHDLATVLHDKGDLEEAEDLYLQVYEQEPLLLGPDHPDLDVGMANLGRLYRDMQRFEESERFLREAIDHSARTRGVVHQFTAYNTNNLARLMADLGRHEESEILYQDVLNVYAQTLEEDHPYIASAQLGYSGLLMRTEEYAKAEAAARNAIDIFLKAVPEDHFLVIQGKTVLGHALLEQSRYDEARSTLTDLWQGFLTEKPSGDAAADRVLKLLVRVAESTGKDDDAARYRQLLQR